MQNDTSLPTPLARATLRALPPHFLMRGLDVLMARMHTRHPRLFVNLERLTPADVLVVPTDLPHAFVLSFGGQNAALTLASEPHPSCDAAITGSLDALLRLLEGKTDSDTLFFTREIEISGNTETVVALRNTLDREEIDLMDDITSLFGPFARPAHEAILLLDSVARHIRQRRTKIA